MTTSTGGGRRRAKRRSDCPINITLEMLGDSWSLLVVRDLLFGGARKFKDLLDASEGVATNILANRLQRLEHAGIIDRHVDSTDARSHVYLLTEKGLGLAPVLIEMVLWAARHEDTGAPPAMVEAMRKNRQQFIRGLGRQWRAARAALAASERQPPSFDARKEKQNGS